MLGDKAYDSAELRLGWRIAEPSRSFLIAATESNRSTSTSVSTKNDGGSKMPSAD
jgi:hypothetical protein